jgi:hypothetical protein
VIPQRALSIAVYLLVADGLAALSLGGLLGLPALALVSVAVAVSWWQELLRRRFELSWLGVVLVGIGGAGLVAEIVTVAAAMLDVFTHLLVFLLLIKLYTRRTPRDARDIAFIAFFMLVAVSPVTTSIVFLGLFVAFLVVGTWLLMLRHLLSEADNATAEALPVRPVAVLKRDLLGLSLAASAATVAITGLLFVVIPRVGQAALPLRAAGSRMVSGFSERVQLGAFGEIEADATIVMRVNLTDFTGGSGPPERLPSLRWRGVAFDHFDGRTWTVGRSTLKLTLRRQRPVAFPVHQFYGGPVLTQEIYLEPLGTEMVLRAPRAAAAGTLGLRHGRRPRQHRGAGAVGAAALHGGVRARGGRPGPGRRRRRPAAARPALAGPLHPAAAGGAAPGGAGPRADGGQHGRLGGRPPALRVAGPGADLHARAGADDRARPARGVRVRPPQRQLRVLRRRAGGDGALAGDPGPRRERLPARRVESLRPLLHGAPA